MRHRHYSAVLIFVLLGFSLGQKTTSDKHGDGTFFFEDTQGDSNIEGSAVDREFSDLDHSSGKGVDDEDSPGSGSGPSEDDDSGSGGPEIFHVVSTGATSTSTTPVAISTTTTKKPVAQPPVEKVPNKGTSDENRIPEIPDSEVKETSTKKIDSVAPPTLAAPAGPSDKEDHNQQDNNINILKQKQDERSSSFFARPGILAAVVGGAVVGLLCAILLVMFIVYRMRKKDEGSYALDEPKRSPTVNSYTRSSNKEFYA